MPQHQQRQPSEHQQGRSRNFDGTFILTATVSNVCGGPVTLTKQNVNVGTPSIDLVNFTNGAEGQGYFCTSNYGNQFQPVFSFIPDNGTIEYRLLSWPSLTVVYTDPSSYSVGVPISVGSSFSPGWYVLEVRLTTSCGSTSWTGFEVEFVDCSEFSGRSCSDCPFTVIAAPNPTDGDLTVTIDKEKKEVKSLSKKEKVRYALYDFNRSQIVKQWTFDNDQNQRTLNVKGIRAGQYILVVTKGKYRQSTQIIVR